MTTIAAGRLSETLQNLVDARLDTIDRMLLGRVNRHDRLAIVREVESQIFDLLHGRDSDSLDREDVLAVLARLDPPEAYLPDESTGAAPPMRYAATPRPVRPTQDGHARLGIVSGVLGIISVVLILIPLLLFMGLGDTGPEALVIILFYGTLTLMFVLGLLAVINAARTKLRSGWSVVGLVTGIISMLACLAVVFMEFAG